MGFRGVEKYQGKLGWVLNTRHQHPFVQICCTDLFAQISPAANEVVFLLTEAALAKRVYWELEAGQRAARRNLRDRSEGLNGTNRNEIATIGCLEADITDRAHCNERLTIVSIYIHYASSGRVLYCALVHMIGVE